MLKNVTLALAAAIAAVQLAPSDSAAQTAPDRLLKIVLPYSAGATVDIYSRMIAQKVEEAGGPKIVIENKPGGGGTIAAMAVKQAPADGGTLFLADLGTFGINVTLMSNLPYDPVKDFAAITPLWSFPSIMSVPPSLGVKSVPEVVALAKRTPGGLSYGSQGVGSGGHLLGEMFAKATGAPLVHVPYRGAAPAVADLVAGQVAFLFGSLGSVQGHYEAKRLDIIAVTSKSRLPVLPDVPTLAELGYPTVDLDVWFGLAAPAGVPEPVVQSLNERFVAAGRSPDVVAKLTSQGINSMTSTAAEFRALIRSDIARVAPIVIASGARVN